MSIELLPIWITSLSAAVGVIYSITKNGRASKHQDIKLKNDILNDMKTIKDRLDDPDIGLKAIMKESTDMKIHCVKTSVPLTAIVRNNTDEIERLRKRLDH